MYCIQMNVILCTKLLEFRSIKREYKAYKIDLFEKLQYLIGGGSTLSVSGHFELRMTFWTAGDFRGRRDGDFWHPPRVRLKVEG